jgi:hypothetical protein
LKLVVVFASFFYGFNVGYELSTTWNLLLQVYRVRLGHETLGILRYSVLQDFSTDLVILSIDQQLLSHDEFDGRVDSFLTLHYHVVVPMVFNFAKLNLHLEIWTLSSLLIAVINKGLDVIPIKTCAQ